MIRLAFLVIGALRFFPTGHADSPKAAKIAAKAIAETSFT